MNAEIGRLAQEVATKTVPVGDEERAVLNNRVAISLGKDKSAFIQIVAWGKLAEFIVEHFGKGDELYFEGYVRNRDYPVGNKTL